MDVSCQCGTVKFKTPLEKPLAIYICHCDECRRQSSSAFGCSAVFPTFDLPSPELLGCYTRDADSGTQMNCYFCKACGVRLVHSRPGASVMSVKGGCIEGLAWEEAKHIWCKQAKVPIPEDAEREEGEPKGEIFDKDGKWVGVEMPKREETSKRKKILGLLVKAFE